MTERKQVENLVDVLQVEDEKYFRESYERKIKEQGLSYAGTDSLLGLREILDKEIIGRVNILDGRFPGGSEDRIVRELYKEAIEIIREKYPEADIILFSLNDLRNEARELNVDCWEKFNLGAKDFAIKLKERLEKKLSK